VVARDGEEGVAKAVSELPDLILNKPINNSELLAKVRSFLEA
jgi:hypothetical protein